DGDLPSRNRSRDDEPAVGRDVDVVDAAFGADALDARQRRRVDDVNRAGAGDDRGVYAPAILADGDVVRVVRQRDVLDDLERFPVSDVDRRFGFVGDIEPAAVGGDGRAVVDLDAFNGADDLVG